ncbi:hypothetical protein KOR34_43460 [Posidoniimonas corsicana]|uniref:Transposase IS30-like HTH domain-containing protein n=1 Tax=Posidoniimonas corsicana TaxID=1938618 RepID=A0A5C5UZ84_9BACT|nr:hypothetical protein [Posidoniimonas corsicana]TWT30973.1 hypothetical protein KOR34_43460 [Posidoniimonas corsicana]
MSRPRVLDETKRREVCALLTAGMTLGSAAEYVGCSVKTIRRERDRDDDFDLKVRRAKMAARLGPLQAVRRAAETHWRAAAWLVERQERRDERRRADRRRRVELERVVGAVKEVVRREVPGLPQQWAIEDQIDQIATGRKPRDPKPSLPEVDLAAPPARAKRESPVPAALRELAERVAAPVDEQPPAGQSSDVDAPKRTKPPAAAPAPVAAEPAEEVPNGDEPPTNGPGFVPSLRVFGQNELDREKQSLAAGPVRRTGG